MPDLESSRSLSGQEAIDYLETIRSTYAQSENYRGNMEDNLPGLVALVTLEEAHLHWLSNQDIPQSPITIAPHGFPSLPTLLADAKAAVSRHESIIRSRQQTTLDILADFANLNENALRQNASSRAKQLTSSTDAFMKTMDLIDQQHMTMAKNMIVSSGDTKQKPGQGIHKVISEKSSMVAVQTYNEKQNSNLIGHRFFPVQDPCRSGSGHSFFLICSLDKNKEQGTNAALSPHRFSYESVWMKQLSYTVINWSTTHTSIKNILSTYDTFRYRAYSEIALGALFTAYKGLQELHGISQTTGSSTEEHVVDAQKYLAEGIAQMKSEELPHELSELIGAAIQAATQDVKNSLPKPTGQ